VFVFESNRTLKYELVKFVKLWMGIFKVNCA